MESTGWSPRRGGHGKVKRRAGIRWKRATVLVAGTIALAGLVSCAKRPPLEKPVLHKTKSFEEIYGEVPSLPLPASAYAAVGFFPSSVEPERFRPVPVFSVEKGKEEMIVVRTVIRGIGTGSAPPDPLLAEIVNLFPMGADLTSLTYEGGVAKVTVGGSFRAESLSGAQKEKAGKALALAVSQFGKADRVEVTDGSGTVWFDAGAGGAEVVDIGPPKILGLLAIREEEEKPPVVLSVLFDRPVFVQDAAFYPAGEDTPISGKVYSTGFGMTLEFHPEPKISFDPEKTYRLRLTVRDGKGRKADLAQDGKPKPVVRH
jgi:hypothetical protein